MSAGLKVKCPLCKRVSFKTSEKYDPTVTPNGSMVKSLLSYHHDWLCVSTTKAAEMTCPECLAQLVLYGRLAVVEEKKTLVETEEAFERKLAGIDNSNETSVPDTVTKPHICPVCEKSFTTALALNGHSRSHLKK